GQLASVVFSDDAMADRPIDTALAELLGWPVLLQFPIAIIHPYEALDDGRHFAALPRRGMVQHHIGIACWRKMRIYQGCVAFAVGWHHRLALDQYTVAAFHIL